MPVDWQGSSAFFNDFVNQFRLLVYFNDCKCSIFLNTLALEKVIQFPFNWLQMEYPGYGFSFMQFIAFKSYFNLIQIWCNKTKKRFHTQFIFYSIGMEYISSCLSPSFILALLVEPECDYPLANCILNELHFECY